MQVTRGPSLGGQDVPYQMYCAVQGLAWFVMPSGKRRRGQVWRVPGASGHPTKHQLRCGDRHMLPPLGFVDLIS